MNAVANLPDDIDALKAIILAQQEQNARLEALVAAFRQAMFGRKSEKTDPDQFELALEDIEAGIARVEAEGEANPLVTPTQTSKPRKTNRGSLPKHLPRIEEVIEPESTICDCGHERHVIRCPTVDCAAINERGRRYLGTAGHRSGSVPGDPLPGRALHSNAPRGVTRRPKYACRSCEDGIVQAPARAHLIPGGMPTEATVAHVIVSKYADHLPLYRQAQIYSRQGIDLDRSTLAAWVGRAAFELTPVYDALLANLKRSGKLFMPSRQHASHAPAG